MLPLACTDFKEPPPPSKTRCPRNFGGLFLGCIEADFSESKIIGNRLTRSRQYNFQNLWEKKAGYERLAVERRTANWWIECFFNSKILVATNRENYFSFKNCTSNWNSIQHFYATATPWTKKQDLWKSMRSKVLEEMNAKHNHRSTQRKVCDTWHYEEHISQAHFEKGGCGGWSSFKQTLFGSFTDRDNLVYFAACNQSASGELIGGR